MTEGGRAAAPGDENQATDPAAGAARPGLSPRFPRLHRPRRRGSRLHRPHRRLPRGWLAGLLFVAPMLVLFVVFRFVPVVGAFLLSLTDYRLSGQWSFIALDNYSRLLGDTLFHESLLVTLTYTVIFVPLTVLLVARYGAAAAPGGLETRLLPRRVLPALRHQHRARGRDLEVDLRR